MMAGYIKERVFKINTFIKLDKGMDVVSPVFVGFLSDDILNHCMLLPQVLQDCLGSDLTLRIGDEPTFSFRAIRLTFSELTLHVLHHFAKVIL